MEEKEVKPTKETKDKLFFEIDWEYVEGIATRMSLNKHKYDAFKWKEGINVNELNQALMRHLIAIMKGEIDDEQMYGHYYALGCNSMMAIHELKKENNKKNE